MISKDLNSISQKVEKMEKTYAEVTKSNKDGQTKQTNNDVNVVIRNLPESENELIENKVNSVLKDGLRLREVLVESAERKKSFRQDKPGVVIAKLRSIEDKRKVMEKKRELKQSRNYKDIFIENDIPKAQRLMNNNLRNIVKVMGSDSLEFKGSRIVMKSRGNTGISADTHESSRESTVSVGNTQRIVGNSRHPGSNHRGRGGRGTRGNRGQNSGGRRSF